VRLCDNHFAELRQHLQTLRLAEYSSRTHAQARERYESDGYTPAPQTVDQFDGALVAYHALLEESANAVRGDSERFRAICFNAICPLCSFDKNESANWLMQAAAIARVTFDYLIGGHA